MHVRTLSLQAAAARTGGHAHPQPAPAAQRPGPAAEAEAPPLRLPGSRWQQPQAVQAAPAAHCCCRQLRWHHCCFCCWLLQRALPWTGARPPGGSCAPGPPWPCLCWCGVQRLLLLPSVHARMHQHAASYGQQTHDRRRTLLAVQQREQRPRDRMRAPACCIITGTRCCVLELVAQHLCQIMC